MKTIEILQAFGGERVTRADLRTIATTLGVDLAHGATTEMGPVLEELAWLEVDERDAPYALALVDMSTACLGEQGAVAARHAASRSVVKPSWWRVLDALRAHGEPRTATQLAPEIRTSVSSVHRWLLRLAELGMIEEVAGTSNRDRPFGLTSLGLTALDGRVTGEPREAAQERADLIWCARRPIQHLSMEPLDRTLYWALLYAVDELLADDAWSPDEVRQARDLRRFLVALGQPAAAEDPFGGAGDDGGTTRARMQAFWWYRDVRGQLDLSLDGERRFLAAMPPADGIGWPLAWSIAAIRVASNVGTLVDKLGSDAEREEAHELQAQLNREARRHLAGLHVPLAEFWRDIAEQSRNRADVEARVAAAQLGVEESAVVFRNLALCREHLRIVVRDNRAWEPIEHGMGELWQQLRRSLPHVHWERTEEAFTWLQANPEIVRAHILRSLADTPELGAAARDWIATVQLENAARQVPTVAGDQNIFRKHEACTKLLAYSAAGDVPKRGLSVMQSHSVLPLFERVQHGRAVRLDTVDVATITELVMELPLVVPAQPLAQPRAALSEQMALSDGGAPIAAANVERPRSR